MKDKIAQRERTDALVGGARTFNEFVKEKASASNITPACVRSLPEIKEEWKQLKAQQKAEKKAEKTATREAKKAEKKAEKEAKKATTKSNVAVAKEKTAIKKVAKKSAVDTENIKMTLIEKAHNKSRAEKPPQEPKVKGRPKKYATAEEARRAKIEATKVLNKAKKAQQTASKVEKPPKQTKSKFDPDVSDAELKIYMAKTDKDLDDVLKSIRKASVRYDNLDNINKKSYDHTLQIYSQKRVALLDKRRKEDDEKDAELERRKKDKATAVQAVSQGKAERQRNIQMFKDARGNVRRQRMADLEEGEIYEGRGLNTDDLKEFNNYGKIQDHLAQHLNDLKEAIDPKDLRDYIHFTKEKARLKSKLVGGLVRMIGGMEQQDLFDVPTLVDTIIKQSSLEQLREMAQHFSEDPRLLQKIITRMDYLSSKEPSSKKVKRSLFGSGAYSSSDSDSDGEMEGGESLGFFGNIKRAFNTSWNNQGTPTERKATSVLLNDIEPTLLTPVNILAPPVGKIAEAQRKLLKSHYNL